MNDGLTPPLHHRPVLVSAEAILSAPAESFYLADTRFDLADPEAGERSWRQARLPGSVYFHLDRDLCGAKTGRNGRHPLPDRADFARTLGARGITPATRVVVVDRQGGMFAARLWWLLRWIGHQDVSVLDGGVPAWSAAGGVLESDGPAPPAMAAAGPVAPPAAAASGAAVPPAAAPAYPASAEPGMGTIDAEGLLARLGRVALVDARAAERFRGDVEPLDRQAGHIPGALNRCFKDNLEPDDRFRPAAELRADFERLLGNRPAAEVVHQCGSGVTACHNLLAMAHAGLDGGLLYPGSWSEWSSDPARPVAQGG